MTKFITVTIFILIVTISVSAHPQQGYNYPRPEKPFNPVEDFGPPFQGEQPPVDSGVYDPPPFNPSNSPNNNARPFGTPEIEPETNLSNEEGEEFLNDDPRTTFAVANANDNLLNQNADQFERLYQDYQNYYQYFS